MSDDLDVLSRLVDYHDHIAPPLVPIADDVRRGRRRVRRNRGIVTGAVAAGVAGVLLTASLVTGGNRSLPEPAEPTPTPTTSQNAQTWVDTTVDATDGFGWNVPDPQQEAKQAWFVVARDHLDPTGEHFDPRGTVTSELDQQFTWREQGSQYPVEGRLGLIIDRSRLDPLDGCRYLLKGQRPSNGTESCSGERLAGPDGEPARITRYQRLCDSWDPGREGDDARPGPGSTYATCGDYQVVVAAERRDGLVGYVEVAGRGTPDFNPFGPAAMVAAATDRRLGLPESAFGVLSDQALESIVVEHFPGYRAGPEPTVTEPLGYARAWGHLGRRVLGVQVRAAGGSPACGRRWLVECVERRVFGADDPTTVYVGTWDEQGSAGCCPKDSRATSREFVYVGPRHTVIVRQSLVVSVDEAAVDAELDQRIIDLLLDPRLQQEAG